MLIRFELRRVELLGERVLARRISEQAEQYEPAPHLHRYGVDTRGPVVGAQVIVTHRWISGLAISARDARNPSGRTSQRKTPPRGAAPSG